MTIRHSQGARANRSSGNGDSLLPSYILGIVPFVLHHLESLSIRSRHSRVADRRDRGWSLGCHATTARLFRTSCRLSCLCCAAVQLDWTKALVA